MKVTTICPCCSTPLLHHFGNHREYWFCRHCWQEMPDFEIIKHQKYRESHQIVSCSIDFPSFKQPLLTS